RLVTPMFNNSHPRVRYATCQCVGAPFFGRREFANFFCSGNNSRTVQYGGQLFAVLTPTLEAPKPSVHFHAAATLINFCEGVARDTLVPYSDTIFECLVKLLNPTSDNAKQSKRYVQEQAISVLAMVADASEATFAKVSQMRLLSQ
ncbi:hypothetical protein PILCRDRAFT_82479, partial [Piloderma croceum F 1598]